MAKKSGSVFNKSFSKKNMYSVKDGAKYIAYSDGSKSNRDGSAKTTGYIPNTKANRDRISSFMGKPDRYGDRLMWW
ncbi:MAG: hypothetical protein E7650_06700 [Ruminococcaceae bacterium]|nr:hypothetical protein [Oscillospiraceae bacterium]